MDALMRHARGKSVQRGNAPRGCAFAFISAASTIAAAATTAHAGPFFIDAQITTTNGSGFSELVAFPEHEVGSTESSPGPLPMVIDSGISSLEGWEYQATLDYSGYDIGYFFNGNSVIDLWNFAGLGMPGPIAAATAFNGFGEAIGTLSFDGGSIHWEGSVASILEGGQAVTIHWNHIPGPSSGVLALSLAGLAACRRRR